MRNDILVVEDELSLQNVIRLKLSKNGFIVHVANSVESALAVIKKVDNIKAIWLDHYLVGEGSGIDLVANLKNDDEYKKIPIFIVSNTASPDKLKGYIGLGVEKYYTKSNFSLSEIINDISERIKMGEK